MKLILALTAIYAVIWSFDLSMSIYLNSETVKDYNILNHENGRHVCYGKLVRHDIATYCVRGEA